MSSKMRRDDLDSYFFGYVDIGYYGLSTNSTDDEVWDVVEREVAACKVALSAQPGREPLEIDENKVFDLFMEKLSELYADEQEQEQGTRTFLDVLNDQRGR